MTVRQVAIGSVEYAAALELRERMLRQPLGLTLTAAEHALEPDCFHLGGFEGERLIAVLLLQPMSARTVKMRQVAVDPEFQSRGIGTQLVRFAEDFARANGFAEIIAHARSTAVRFYLRLGYIASGAEFIEATIPHRLVTRKV